MPDIPLLPHPGPATAGAVLYLSTGLLFCTLASAPLPRRCAPSRRDGFGVRPAHVLLAAVALLADIALWPAPLAWTAARRWHAHRARARTAPRIPAGSSPALGDVLLGQDEALDPPIYLTQTQTTADGRPEDSDPGATTCPVAASARIVDALEGGRLLDAAWAARTVVWDTERAFGPNSSQLWHATELLAHVCHEIGDDLRAVQLSARAAHGWAQNFGAGSPEARAAFNRARALWATARASGTTDPATALVMASVTALFAHA